MSRGLLSKHRYYFLFLGTLVLGTLAAMPDVARADSMRCGKWVVNESVTIDELLNKCGPPQNKNVTKDDVWITNVNGVRVKTGGVTVTERWIYQASSRSLPMAVLIVDGKLVSLTRAD